MQVKEWALAVDPRNINALGKPVPNKYVPDDTTIITSPEDRLRLNTDPVNIELCDANMEKKITLYHSLDQVWLKPKTIINIVMRIK